MKRLRTPLMLMAPILVVLLAGAFVTQRNQQRRNKHLFDAAYGGDAAQIRGLCRKGADPTAIFDKGGAEMTPLHIAAQQGHDEAIKALMACGTGVNVDTTSGPTQMTPLMLAAWRGHSSTVRLLLAKGANPNLKTQRGRTSLHFAQEMLKFPLQKRKPDPKLLETVRVLRAAGGKS